MTKIIKYIICTVVGSWVLLLAVPASAQVSFELLEPPHQRDWAEFSLSRDGENMGCLFGGAVYWWTATEGFRFVNAGSPGHGGVGMSAFGNALIAARDTDTGTVPAIWYQDGSFTELGAPSFNCDDDRLHDLGYDLNADGSVAVGQADSCNVATAFVWSQQAGFQRLASATGEDSRSKAVSADGELVVGFCEHPTEGFRRPAYWQSGEGPHLFLGHSRVGEALNVSLNGLIVVGQAELGRVSPQAFYWTAGQEPIALGNLSGKVTDSSLASAVSDNGTVVGWCGDELFGDQEAFVWSARIGMRSLAELAVAGGVELPAGLKLTGALDISGDGTTVVGVGRDEEWNLHYWRMHLGDAMNSAPVAKATQPMQHKPDPVNVDTLGVDRAGMLHPFPFGKRQF